MSNLKYTKLQLKILQEINNGFTKNYKEICLNGGRRSGKTFLLLSIIINRALASPLSKHIIVRNNRISIKYSVWNDTIKNQFMQIDQYKKIFEKCKFNESELTILFPNGSEIILKGLDNIEKGLGTEMSTIYFNECSEITFNKLQASSGLASKRRIVKQGKDYGELQTLKLYDYNPPYKTHWSYKLFEEKKNPTDDQPLSEERIKKMFIARMNPVDNLDNIDKEYLKELEAFGGKDSNFYKRFALGLYTDEKQEALFKFKDIEEGKTHDLNGLSTKALKIKANIENIFIGIDPAVSTNEKSDLTGISVCGYGVGMYYILEDASGKYTPNQWAEVALNLCVKWGTQNIIIETNQGGLLLSNNLKMVQDKLKLNFFVLNIIERRAQLSKVFDASNRFDNPKLARAQIVKNLYDAKKIKQIDFYKNDTKLNNLELLNQEMLHFDGTGKSPDRMDSMVYAITALIECNANNVKAKSNLHRLIFNCKNIENLFNQ